MNVVVWRPPGEDCCPERITDASGWTADAPCSRKPLTTPCPGFHRAESLGQFPSPRAHTLLCTCFVVTPGSGQPASAATHRGSSLQASGGGTCFAFRVCMSDLTALFLTSGKNTPSQRDSAGSSCCSHSRPVLLCSAAPGPGGDEAGPQDQLTQAAGSDGRTREGG